jgi:hypothetical protein
MTEQTKIADSLHLDVMPLREATDNVTALEARGDFKFRGIYGLYNYVLEATNRFSTNRILPEIAQLKREVPVPENKFDEYILELTGRGSMKVPMVLMFPSVDFIPSSGKMNELVILCRPTQADGTSAKKYVDFYRQKSLEALNLWLRCNESHWLNMDVDSLYRSVSQGAIQNTHAGAVIAKFFLLSYDRTAEEKSATFKTYVRPIIQQLIDEKKLLYLKDAALNFHTIQFADELSLKHRVEMLSACCVMAIPGFQNSVELDPDRISEQVEQHYRSNLSPAQRQVVAELRLVLAEYQRLLHNRREKEQKEQLGNALAEVSRLDHVVPTTYFRNWNEEFMRRVLALPEVLSVEFPLRGKVFTFLLAKQKVYPAVISARKILDEKGDETEVRILSAMEVGRYLEGDQLRAFEDLEDRIFFDRLPFFVRLWRSLFGRRRLTKEENIMIRERLRKEELEEQIQIKKREAERTTRQIAQEQVEKKKKNPDDDVVPANTLEEQTAKTKESMRIEERAEEILRKVIDLLDAAWDRKELPNRTHVLNGVPEFEGNEDLMISFLKKYGRKQIYSFRVLRDDPAYIWPVLISRRYIQRHGKRLLQESMEESDRQRKALMPDQEKFDVATAIEDFLTKLMARR